MLFNSIEFILCFLPVTIFLYYFLARKSYVHLARIWLLLASLFFYSWWNIYYLPLILGSILANFTFGRLIQRRENKSKKAWGLLLFGLIFNLGLLAYFKYADFFIENLNLVLRINVSSLHLLLPLAISFFTFQQVAYLVDSYRGDAEKYSFLDYSLFVTFFPQLIAGPIVKHQDLIPQINTGRCLKLSWDSLALGIFIFSIGLFKKIVIADSLSPIATAIFDHAKAPDLIESWVAIFAYAFQLYFDFSGYSDMAIGLGFMFNIKLPLNFNSPYKALNIQDFWRRWHITLSLFLRDYLYIPTGGSRGSHIKTYSNLMLTFIVGGLWHGAGWTFIFWGFLHGLALVLHRIWHSWGLRMSPLLARSMTFLFVCFAWVFFRATSWKEAIKVLKGAWGGNGIVLPRFFYAYFKDFSFISFGGFAGNLHQPLFSVIFMLCLSASIAFFMKNVWHFKNQFSCNRITLLASLVLFLTGLTLIGKASEFLYFNF